MNTIVADNLSDDQQTVSFGHNLYTVRQKKGLSLEEISKTTKVSKEILQFIEKGNHEKLPADTFVIGFIKAYSDALSIDRDENVKLYKSSSQQLIKASLLVKKNELSKKRVQTGVVLLIFAVILGIIVASIVFFTKTEPNIIKEDVHDKIVLPNKVKLDDKIKLDGKIKFNSKDNTSEQSNNKNQMSSEEKVLQEELLIVKQQAQKIESSKTDIITDEQQLINESNIAKIPLPDLKVKKIKSIDLKNDKTKANKPDKPDKIGKIGKKKLKIICIDETWVKIIVDGKKTVQFLLQPGNEKQLEANSKFNILLGNAKGVKLILDGKPVKISGQDGQVTTMQIP